MKVWTLDSYYKQRRRVPSWIYDSIDKKEIIHGSISQDIQTPQKHLKSYRPQDYDVFSYQPQLSAQETEALIESKMGGDYFEVVKGKHKGTYKLKSKIDGKTYADFTIPKQKIKYKIINGKKYRSLADLKRHTQRTIKNKTATHRLTKDKDMLYRMRLRNLKKARAVRKSNLRKTKSTKRRPSKRRRQIKSSLW